MINETVNEPERLDESYEIPAGDGHPRRPGPLCPVPIP